MTVPAQAVVVPAAETSLTEGQFLGRLELFNEDGSPWTPPSGAVSWAEVTDKPAVIAAGDTQAAARTAIGAGTSNLTIGTTATTAAAGNDPRLSDQRVPTDGSVSAPKLAAELAHLGDIPAPPATGTYVLTSTDGVLSWVAQA